MSSLAIGEAKWRCVTSFAMLTGLIALLGLGLVRPASAAPATCSPGASAAAAVSSPAATQSVAKPVPTEAAIAPEVNPPGDIPDNQAFVTYQSRAGGYSLSVPEGWARQESGANAGFADKLHQITVEVSCTSTPLTLDSAKTIDVPRLAKSVPAFQLMTTEMVSLPAGQAVLIRYQANSAPDAVTGKQYRLDVDRYEFFQSGKVAALSMSAPAGSDNVDVWRYISESFRWS